MTSTMNLARTLVLCSVLIAGCGETPATITVTRDDFFTKITCPREHNGASLTSFKIHPRSDDEYDCSYRVKDTE